MQGEQTADGRGRRPLDSSLVLVAASVSDGTGHRRLFQRAEILRGATSHKFLYRRYALPTSHHVEGGR